MGHLVRKKLKSRRGVTMIMAMLFMLICSAVGAVVLSAASANAGHIDSTWESEREYLAVASAVNMLKDDIRKLELTASYTGTKTTHTTKKEESGETTKVEEYEYDATEIKNEVDGSCKLITNSHYTKYMNFWPALINLKYDEGAIWDNTLDSADRTAFTAAFHKEGGELVNPFIIKFAPTKKADGEGESKPVVDLPVVEAKISWCDENDDQPFAIIAVVYSVNPKAPGSKGYCTKIVFSPHMTSTVETVPTPGIGGPVVNPEEGTDETIEVEKKKKVFNIDWNMDPEIERVVKTGDV